MNMFLNKQVVFPCHPMVLSGSVAGLDGWRCLRAQAAVAVGTRSGKRT